VTFSRLSVTELRDLAESVMTVAAAAEASVFTGLADGPARPAELADRLGLDQRAVTIVLPVLAELGLVAAEAEGGRYRLTARAERELADPASPDYQAGGLPLWLENMRAWTTLADTLRSGRPTHPAGTGGPEADEAEGRAGIARFMRGMAAAPGERVTRLVDTVLERRPEAGRVLDLGGGPGHISRAFIERGLSSVLVDRPEVVGFVREEYRLDEVRGLETVGADFLADPLPPGPFDIVLLSNILHMLSAEQSVALLRRSRTVLVPGGVVAIADFLRGRSPRAARFALVMLLRTERGNTYTLAEHEAWLAETGFHRVEVADLDPERQLVTAVALPGPVVDTSPPPDS
jgi:SAM-dependent methyltransferase